MLKQYADLKEEIHSLEKRIEKLEIQAGNIEHDSVTGSDTEFPYTKRPFHIEGVGYHRLQRLARLRCLLLERKEMCEEMNIRIETFISTIPDSLTRVVFQYRYIDGHSWFKIARLIGRHDESYPRKIIHDKYLDNLK